VQYSPTPHHRNINLNPHLPTTQLPTFIIRVRRVEVVTRYLSRRRLLFERKKKGKKRSIEKQYCWMEKSLDSAKKRKTRVSLGDGMRRHVHRYRFRCIDDSTRRMILKIRNRRRISL